MRAKIRTKSRESLLNTPQTTIHSNVRSYHVGMGLEYINRILICTDYYARHPARRDGLIWATDGTFNIPDGCIEEIIWEEELT